MSKREHPVSQVLRLIDGLTDDQKAIVRDRLRAPRSSKSSSPAKPARNQLSSKKRGLPGATPSTSTDTGAAQSAAAGSGGGGD